jgi:small subunit ribosomal protein S24e
VLWVSCSPAQSDAPITLRTRKFITNRLLARKQFVLDVLHPNRANVSRAELSEKLAAMYKADAARVVCFGFKTVFGGGRSTGFALIYDDEASQKKFEPRHRLVRVRPPRPSLRVDLCGSAGRSSADLPLPFPHRPRPQSGLAAKVEKASRKLRKERKNRSKKVRGVKKVKAGEPAKKK